MFIVIGFTIFGLTQSVASLARRRSWRRTKLTLARVIGVAGTLPLFVAAGSIMMPTVVGAGLASARREWRPAFRWVWALVAAIPVVIVTKGFIDSFGWSVRSALGFAAMSAVYGTIVSAARFTFAARPDGWRLPRWMRVTLLVGSGLATLFLTAGFVFR